MKKDEDGKRVRESCNIIGVNPFDELKLNYDFQRATNTFIFYIKEKKMVYSEAIDKDAIEYVALGWDVLYPVKHSDFFVFNLFNTKRFITEEDLLNE